jgi:tetratricopeptide (TPR) repeat protein
MAQIRTGRSADADVSLAELRRLAATPEFKEYTVFGINTLASLLDIAQASLAGEIEAKKGNVETAISLLEHAVRVEDGLIYSEPPDWHFPPRHQLGAILLNAGRASEAYTVYSEDLRRNPDNGWALYGLAQAHRALKRDQEAAEAEARLKKAWAGADFPLVASRF